MGLYDQRLAGRFLDLGGAVTNVLHPDVGARGDGEADDTAVLTALPAGHYVLPAGRYRLRSGTLPPDALLSLVRGALLAPDPHSLVRLTGPFECGLHQAFAGSGRVEFAPGTVEALRPEWFKSPTGDWFTALDKAVHAAAGGGEFGAAVVLSARNYDGFDGEIIVPSYTRVLGSGHASRITLAPGASAGSVFKITAEGANGILLSDFAIDGDGALQRERQNGVHFAPEGGPAIYCRTRNLLVKEMSGHALRSERGGVNQFMDQGSIFRDSFGHNVFLSAARNGKLIGTVIRSAKSGASGMLAESDVRDFMCEGVTFESNGDRENGYGLWLSLGCSRFFVHGGAFRGNGRTGVHFDRVTECRIAGRVQAHANGELGALFRGCVGISAELDASRNGDSGAVIESTRDSLFDVVATSNNLRSGAAGDGVALRGASRRNTVRVYARVAAGRQQYGLAVRDDACSGNVLEGDVRGGGLRQDLLDRGQGSRRSRLVTAGGA